MKPTILAIAVVMILMSGDVRAQTTKDDVRAAATSLKKAHVLRSFEICLLSGGDETRCKKLIQLEYKRELKVLKRLLPAVNDPAINSKQFTQEMSACYSPNNTYTHLIDCWVRLSDRLDAAKNGVFLLKR